MEEMTLYVFYDIPDDKTRNKVGEKCKDYGLCRAQFSGFEGTLDKNKREQLVSALKRIIADKQAVLLVQPVCAKCLKDKFVLENKKQEEKDDKPKIYFGMPLNRSYMDSED